MIYIDMDDVCADLNGYVNREFGTDKQVGQPIKLEHWNELVRYHPRLFRDLEVNEQFVEAFDLIERVMGYRDIAFLTALPYQTHFPYASMDKVDWIREHFGNRYPVFFGPYPADKQNHCSGPEDLLVDDNAENCLQWQARGGVARIYRNETFLDWFGEGNYFRT